MHKPPMQSIKRQKWKAQQALASVSIYLVPTRNPATPMPRRNPGQGGRRNICALPAYRWLTLRSRSRWVLGVSLVTVFPATQSKHMGIHGHDAIVDQIQVPVADVTLNGITTESRMIPKPYRCCSCHRLPQILEIKSRVARRFFTANPTCIALASVRNRNARRATSVVALPMSSKFVMSARSSPAEKWSPAKTNGEQHARRRRGAKRFSHCRNTKTDDDRSTDIIHNTGWSRAKRAPRSPHL